MKFIDLMDAQMPVLGFGTWKLTGDACARAVKEAMDIGYRHIDTAQIYENEAEVGQGIKNAGVLRDKFFLTTKVWRSNFDSTKTAQASIEESLKKLKVDYVDLLLIHWPFPEHDIEKMLDPILDAQEKGLTRLVGVSNFTVAQMDKAREYSAGKVLVNQVEYHPNLNQKPVLDYIQKHDMALTAYSPLGRGAVLDDVVIAGIAKEHGKTPAQICLRWAIQQGRVAAIPKSATKANIEANFNIFDFELSEDQMTKISGLARDDGRLVNPDFAPSWDNASAKKAA